MDEAKKGLDYNVMIDSIIKAGVNAKFPRVSINSGFYKYDWDKFNGDDFARLFCYKTLLKWFDDTKPKIGEEWIDDETRYYFSMKRLTKCIYETTFLIKDK